MQTADDIPTTTTTTTQINSISTRIDFHCIVIFFHLLCATNFYFATLSYFGTVCRCCCWLARRFTEICLCNCLKSHSFVCFDIVYVEIEIWPQVISPSLRLFLFHLAQFFAHSLCLSLSVDYSFSLSFLSSFSLTLVLAILSMAWYLSVVCVCHACNNMVRPIENGKQIDLAMTVVYWRVKYGRVGWREIGREAKRITLTI